MSGSIALSSASLTDAERTDVRRFCGYPAYGSGSAGFSSWRFFQAYGALEFRLTNLAPAEFQVLRQYLVDLYALEAAIPASGANLDTAMAAVWTHNKNEVADRLALMKTWQSRLAAFLGIPPGPTFGGTSSAIVI